MIREDEPQHEPPWVDIAISRLLRMGVVASTVVVLLGLTISFIHHPAYLSSHTALGELTNARTIYPHRLNDVTALIRRGRGQAIVMAGLLMLIATPVARVAFSIVAFAIEKDHLYVFITVLVLTLLLTSFLIGAAE